MERKLFISDDAIEKYGKEYFEDFEADYYANVAVPGYTQTLVGGLLVSCDDMGNIYIHVTEDDECYTDVEDLK